MKELHRISLIQTEGANGRQTDVHCSGYTSASRAGILLDLLLSCMVIGVNCMRDKHKLGWPGSSLTFHKPSLLIMCKLLAVKWTAIVQFRMSKRLFGETERR